ncbi:MAG: outer membrane protein G [Salibacteraceae bacterium]|jgi:outer membrane protein G
MKNLFIIVAILSMNFAFSQAYTGAGDVKFQLGANIQSGGNGIAGSLGFGLGENISIGVYSAYLLGIQDSLEPEFKDRFDIQGRFNANLGSVLGASPNLDVYPGLHLGTRNFGGHIGLRYFFSPSFGLYSEVHVPFAFYNPNTLKAEEELNNQFVFTIGASFNI